MDETTVKTICFECHSRCGVILEVSNGKVVGIKGDKEHPFSHGYLCAKGRACMEIIYHPDRIKETKPDYVLILPWNLKDEIMEQMAHVRDWGGQFVVLIPEVEICH